MNWNWDKNRLHFDFAFYLALFFMLELVYLYNMKRSEGFTALPPILSSSETFDPVKINTSKVNVDPHEIGISPMEQRFIDSGLVNIRWLDPSIKVDLKYSTTDNFLGLDVYGELDEAFLQRDVAEKLVKAQQFLKKQYPFYNLVIYDAVRPRSIQYKMWDTIKIPAAEKAKYLSNPKYGSLHNYGAAVDISIIDELGIALDMGTPYDYFGELAHPEKEEQMIGEGKLTHAQTNNRKLLRDVMEKAGFFNIQTEWWHFNSCYRKEAATRYRIVE